MQSWRIQTLRIFLVVLFLGVIVRLGYWQLIDKDQLQAQADNQHTSESKTIGERGAILFADGSTVVGSKLSYLVFADKKFIKDPDQTAKLLEPYLQISEATLSAKLQQNLAWIPLAPQIPAETKQALDKLHVSGIGFDRSEQRYYPEASMAANLLGFVGKDDSGRNRGYFGLEGYYDTTLAGKEGYTLEQTDVAGQPLLTAQTIENAAKPGSTLILNIDRTVQFIAEQKLKEGLDQFHAQGGDVVVMDPNTGAIIAMAALPNYDPTHYYDASPSAYKNPIVSDTYEPGSTFKTIIMAAAIDAGVVKSDTRCPCQNEPIKVSGFTIHNWDNTYRPNELIGDVLKNSDNNAMTWVGQQLGQDKLIEYIQKFGFGASTNIDLENEEVPQLRAKKDWYQIDYATAAFGQGIAVTPIELLTAESAIANGGKLLEPHVVKSIVTDTKRIDIKPRVIRQVLSENGAKTMRQLLQYDVENSEAKRLYKPAGFSFAGKTGTAQIPIAGHYDSDSDVLASYIGFAPVDHPRFIMLVRFNKPVGGEHGALTAEPVFYNIAKELLTYWNISPDMPQ